jgi:hypothetical protein
MRLFSMPPTDKQQKRSFLSLKANLSSESGQYAVRSSRNLGRRISDGIKALNRQPNEAYNLL